MRFVLLALSLAFILAASHSPPAEAVPILIGYGDIDAQTEEDFEGYPAGPYAGPFNGFSVEYTSNAESPPSALVYNGFYCASNCLASTDISGFRTLLGFATGTTAVGLVLDTHWDTAYDPPIGHPGIFEIAVVGHSGEFTTLIQPTETVSLGFFDAGGLVSVTTRSMDVDEIGGGVCIGCDRSSTWQYSIDNVIAGTCNRR